MKKAFSLLNTLLSYAHEDGIDPCAVTNEGLTPYMTIPAEFKQIRAHRLFRAHVQLIIFCCITVAWPIAVNDETTKLTRTSSLHSNNMCMTTNEPRPPSYLGVRMGAGRLELLLPGQGNAQVGRVHNPGRIPTRQARFLPPAPPPFSHLHHPSKPQPSVLVQENRLRDYDSLPLRHPYFPDPRLLVHLLDLR